MKIVVLDGYTLNPGDLSWEGFESLGQLICYDRTPPDDLIERSRGAEILLTNKTVLRGEHMEALPDLRYIGVLATGYDVVDFDAAAQRGVPVTNVPGYGVESVAQMTFAHILNFTQNVAGHAQAVRDGRWAACPDFCFWDRPLVELEGKTLGVVGLGRIGRAVARVGAAFGMRVIAHDPAAPQDAPPGVEMADLDMVFAEGDVVTLHCPLTADNEKMVDAGRLATMKPSAFLVNTARGALVDEEALAAALDEGRLAGAGLDVLGVEPPYADGPLMRARNCAVTPHISWATQAARSRLMASAVENLRGFLNGQPVNVVNSL